MARREDMKQLASSLVWDMRNAAAQDGQLDSALAQRLDALEEKLLADHCQQEPGFYNDNVRYKGQFLLLIKEATAAGEQVRDGTSFLSRTLAQHQDPSSAAADSNHTSAPTVNIPDNHVPVSSEVSELHSKFTQDPNFKGIRGKFGADKLFAAGIDAIVGPMDVQYIRAMYNEHMLVAGASKGFTAWNAGHKMETTAEREWFFANGSLSSEPTGSTAVRGPLTWRVPSPSWRRACWWTGATPRSWPLSFSRLKWSVLACQQRK